MNTRRMVCSRLAAVLVIVAVLSMPGAGVAGRGGGGRVRCIVAPRVVPPGGGQFGIVAELQGSSGQDQVMAQITRPDGTAELIELAPEATPGRFSALFPVPPNMGRGSQRYGVSLLVAPPEGEGVVVRCGVVRVEPNRGPLPLIIVVCAASPRRLPQAGGAVELVARIGGGEGRPTVLARITTPGEEPQEVPLARSRGGLFRGVFMAPPNDSKQPRAYQLELQASDMAGGQTRRDCGSLIVVGERPPLLMTGVASEGPPHVKVFTGASPGELHSFFAFDGDFTGGVRVALGDVNGDGLQEMITGTGPGIPSRYRFFSIVDRTQLGDALAYGASFAGGIFVASGDVNGDGRDEIITGAGPGAGPHVKVFDGRSGAELSSFFAYAPGFKGGVRVAAGDVDGDGFADIITGSGLGAQPHVKVFDGATTRELRSFFAFPGFTGGVFVASVDVNGDGRDDIITGAGSGAQPHVKVFDGRTGRTEASFFAYGAGFTGGVSVGAGDVNGDGRDDIITGAGPGAPGGHVKVFSGVTLGELGSFFAFAPTFTGGVFVGGVG